jgi:uncharacterized delta-60 repeat protein
MKFTHIFVLALYVVCSESMSQTGGSLDTSFAQGAGRREAIAFSRPAISARAIAQHSNGRIVVAGTCGTSGAAQMCVTRLLPDGSDDPSFLGPQSSAIGRVLVPTELAGNDWVNAMALQPDGKTVIAGACSNGVGHDMCIARLNSDGTLDDSFFDADNGTGSTTGGKFAKVIGAFSSEIFSLAIQPDGKIIAVGSVNGSGSSSRFAAIRFHPNGTTDSGFNPIGDPSFSTYAIATPQLSPRPAARANNVILKPDGKMVVVGTCGISTPVASYALCFVGLLANGARDPLFPDIETDIVTNTSGRSGAVLLPNGTIHAVKAILVPPWAYRQVRVSPTGVVNPFGFAGDRAGDMGSLAGVALQADGKLLVFGETTGGTPSGASLVRLTASGQFDTSFPAMATTTPSRVVLPGFDRGSIAVQTDAKIILAGVCGGGASAAMCVARLHAGDSEARTCSPDIDGDGAMNPLIDGLIITRAMLGMTGSAVIQGMSFQSHALRKTWPTIRDYLVSQCGVRVQ